MSARLAGRVALVTGGSRGLGAATARRLAAEGALVGVGGRDEQAVETVVDAICSDGGRATACPADVTDAAALATAVADLERAFGPVDALAAFAGGGGRPVLAAELPPEEWARVLETNLTATFLTVRAVLPAMLDRAGGSIVTMSSSAGRGPTAANLAYAAAKAGVVGLTTALAGELGRHGIRVNCLAPATVVNDRMTAHTSPEQRAQLAEAVTLGRLGEPDDVASAAAYLLSDDAAWVTGVTLDVTGGGRSPR